MWRYMTRFVTIYALIVWLKPRWKTLSIAAFSLVFVNYFHSEYIGYVEASNDTSFLALSYKIKVVFNLLAIFGVFFGLKYNSSKKTKPHKDSKSRPKSAQGGSHRDGGMASESESALDPNIDDGFDFIRNKKVLRNQAEKILRK